MHSIRIDMTVYKKEALSSLIKNIKNLKTLKIIKDIDINRYTNYAFLILKSENFIDSLDKSKFNEYIEILSNSISDFIIDNYEKRLIKRIVNINFCYLENIEKIKIIKKIYNYLDSSDKNSFLSRNLRKKLIINNIINYITSSENIIIDGFVNFRLKEYINELEQLVDLAVSDFLVEREYTQFISLLKYFVDIQKDGMELIHVIPLGNKYAVLNQDKKEISNEFTLDLSTSDEYNNEMNEDDLLLSALITISPKKIIIHCSEGFKNQKLLNTIIKVFDKRLSFCQSCDLCKSNNVL